jgi:hypothetical protein
VNPSLSVDVTWLLSHLEQLSPTFKINRAEKRCRTPRRNDEIEKALSNLSRLNPWSSSVCSYIERLFSVQDSKDLDQRVINSNAIFVPVVPLFEKLPEIEQTCA